MSVRWVVWLAGATAVAGCGGAQVRHACSLPQVARMRVTASERVNLDEKGRPLPTRIRIYQLEEANVLARASYKRVWAQPEETFGDALVDSDELTVFPGRQVTRAFEPEPATRFVAVVGIFREPRGRGWYSVTPLPEGPEDGDCQGERARPQTPLQVQLEGSRVRARVPGLPECGVGGCVGARSEARGSGAGGEASLPAGTAGEARQTPGADGRLPVSSGSGASRTDFPARP